MRNIHSSRRNKTKFLLLPAGFFFLFGILLLSLFGPIELACKRVNINQVDCSLTKSVALGFIKRQEITLHSLREVKLDKQFKETLESEGKYNPTYVVKTPVYGVLMVSSEATVLNGYSTNQEEQQKMVNQINVFLNDSNAPNLVIQYRNYWLDILILSSLGLSISLSIGTQLKEWAKKSLNRNGA
jgi:hypothetical protein